jgi:hypothetical protein
MPYYEVTLRGRKEPVRFGADWLNEGKEWLIAYDAENKEVIRFQANQVLTRRTLDEGGIFGVA